jgi:hypothetical protein
VALTIAVGVLEIFGFALIAYDLYRLQRHEYGTAQFIARWKGRLRRLLGKSKDYPVHVDEMAGTIAMTGRGKARRGSGEGLEERVDALEENLQRLDEEVDEHRAPSIAAFWRCARNCEQLGLRWNSDSRRPRRSERIFSAFRSSCRHGECSFSCSAPGSAFWGPSWTDPSSAFACA